MTPDTYDNLIDQFDKHLGDPEQTGIPPSVSNDPEILSEWKYLHTAVEAIRFSGLNDQVAAVKNQLHAERAQIRPIKTLGVRKLVLNSMKIAAGLLLILSFSGLAKYILTTPTGVYDKYYVSYELGTSRGAVPSDNMEKAYRNKDWASVQHIFETTGTPTNKDYFLAGMAELEQDHFAGAIEKFKTVLGNNNLSHDSYFQDESEYYLAMSYLANSQAGLAMPLFRKIKADPNHLFNQKVANMSRLDMMILNAK